MIWRYLRINKFDTGAVSELFKTYSNKAHFKLYKITAS